MSSADSEQRCGAPIYSIANSMIFEVLVGGRSKAHRLEIDKSGAGWKCQLDGTSIAIDAISPRPDVISIIVAGRSYEVKREQAGNDLKLWLGSVCLPVELRDPRSLRSRLKAGGDKRVR